MEEEIKDKIHSIRGLQVMLDSDLALLYNIETKYINRAVKRNIERFPEEFMFELTENEYNSLRSQFVTSKVQRFQIGTSKEGRGGRTYLPYVFTEQGVAMLSGVLKSDIAVKISIQIMNAFVNMRKFINTNADIFFRLDRVEKKTMEYDKNFEKIFLAIEDKTISKKQGIFFDGQIFDAFTFVSDLIRSANTSIILIDNYIDDSVLTLLNKRKDKVNITILTKEISKQLLLDLNKYNSQYPPISVREFENSHDRFLIIDNKDIYHFGASLKDLGKRWCAFSKFNKEAFNLLNKLENILP